jgi:WD40 repeat protein
VTATRPYQQATPGVFTTCFAKAAGSLATAGNAPATLGLGALMGAVQSDLEGSSQNTQWHQIGMDGREPAFLLNPRYRSQLVDVDLLEQERARHAEQRDAQLRDRFLPASRWFTGRRKALLDLSEWLLDPRSDPRPRVMTGRAGSGKTAVLGLLAVLSDPFRRPSVPLDGLPDQVSHLENTIDEVIYAGSMTVAQVRDQIAAAGGVRADTVQALIEGLNSRMGRPLVVLVDALDEAANPEELCKTLLLPLALLCQQAVRLLLGSRPHLLASGLLGAREQTVEVDLDSPTYADPASIRAYVRRILLSDDSLDSYYKPSGIYRTGPPNLVAAVTEAIGAAAGDSFLVARIAASTESTAGALPDPKDPAWKSSLPRLAGEAMRRDLHLRLGDKAQLAAELLLPLAYAQGSGLPWEDIWPRLADVLSPGHKYGNDELIWLRRAAGSYAVEGVWEGRSAYRLYHQSLAEHLRDGRDPASDQRLITTTLLACVPPVPGGGRDWQSAHPYIRTHTATHAAAGGMIDPFLEDPRFLMAASRPELLAAVDAASSERGKRNAIAFRQAAPRLRSRPSREHASYLQLAAHCGRAPDLADKLDSCRTADSWSTRWAAWRASTPHHTLTGHTGAVRALAVTDLDGRPVVVSGSNDSTIRVWDLGTGTLVAGPFRGHTGYVRAVAVAELDGRAVVVSGADDQSVRVWDLRTGAPLARISGGQTGYATAVAELDGCPVVISAFDHGTIKVWSLRTGAPIAGPFTGHTGYVTSVEMAEPDGRPVVVSGADDGTVRVWDLRSGTSAASPVEGHTAGVTVVATAQLNGRPVVVSGAHDRTVRVWDLGTGNRVGEPFTGHFGSVWGVAVAELDGRPIVVSGADDRAVRVWDLGTGAPVGNALTGHTGAVRAVAVAELDGRPVIVSGANDETVRVWDLGTERPIGDQLIGHTGYVNALAVAELDGRSVVVSGADDRTVRVWDLRTGAPVAHPFNGHFGRVTALAAAELDGRPIVVSGAGDRTVRVWNLRTGDQIGEAFYGHTTEVTGVACLELAGRHVVISCAKDGTERVWDLGTHEPVDNSLTIFSCAINALVATKSGGLPIVLLAADDGTVRIIRMLNRRREIKSFPRHSMAVTAVAMAELDGRPVVVSGGDDRSVRVWDLRSGALIGQAFTGHVGGVSAVAVAALDGRSVVVSGADDRTVRVWDLGTGAPVGEPFTGHTGGVKAVAVAKLDGRTAVISGADRGTVRVWDLSTRTPVVEPFAGHTGPVNAVAVAALDGRSVVVSGADDRTVRVWDLGTGAPVGEPFTGHTGAVTAVAVAVLHGRPVVLSAAYDRTVRVWDLGTRAPVGMPFTRHARRVTALAVAELNGRPIVVSGAENGTVYLWDLETRSLIRNPIYGSVAIAVGELDGYPVVVFGRPDGIRVIRFTDRRLRVKPLTRRFKHVTTVVVAELDGQQVVVSTSRAGAFKIHDFVQRSELGGMYAGPYRVSATASLHADLLVVAAGRVISVRDIRSLGEPLLTIELDSDITAVATEHATVVAATALGLVALDLPPLSRATRPAEATYPARTPRSLRRKWSGA